MDRHVRVATAGLARFLVGPELPEAVVRLPPGARFGLEAGALGVADEGSHSNAYTNL
jgi:hypothetical protein